MSTLETLEKWTQAWPQAEREELGREFGIGWTALRYQGSGSMEGLEFLYPFLNDSNVSVKRRALDAVATIFSGTGVDGLEKLSYVSENRDLFVRDRAVSVIGSALKGEPVDVILDILRPSLTHRNNFIRGQATDALGRAGEGEGWKDLLPIFAERLTDPDDFVASSAVEGLGFAFSGIGDPDAIALLEPLPSFPTVPKVEGEARRSWHFRWRLHQARHDEAAMAIARIGSGSGEEANAIALMLRYLHPEVPQEMGFEGQLIQRKGVWAAAWLLEGSPTQALDAMRFLLERPGAGEPRQTRQIPRSAAIWSLPTTFRASGREGIEAAGSLLDEDGHASIRTGMLSLGIAARGSCDDDVRAALAPYLTDGNGALRDVANIALGFAFQGSGDGDVYKLLRTTNLEESRGASTNYPLSVGLLFQGTGDGPASHHLRDLVQTERRRLRRHIALGIGLVHQGTSSPSAVEEMLPLLEGNELDAGSEALLLVDFDSEALAVEFHADSLADGPGAAGMFVREHLCR